MEKRGLDSCHGHAARSEAPATTDRRFLGRLPGRGTARCPAIRQVHVGAARGLRTRRRLHVARRRRHPAGRGGRPARLPPRPAHPPRRRRGPTGRGNRLVRALKQIVDLDHAGAVPADRFHELPDVPDQRVAGWPAPEHPPPVVLARSAGGDGGRNAHAVVRWLFDGGAGRRSGGWRRGTTTMPGRRPPPVHRRDASAGGTTWNSFAGAAIRRF